MIRQKLRNVRFLRTLGALALMSGIVTAEDSKVIIDDKNPQVPDDWAICTMLNNPVLYENDENCVLQKLSLTGRLQGDSTYFQSHGQNYNRLEWRRFRTGFKAELFNDFKVISIAEYDLNELDPMYDRLTDSYISWSRSDEFELKIGKHSAGFTLDGATSSKELIRMERSLLSTNLWFPEEYHSGVAATGEVGKVHYNIGAFSGSSNPEYGDFYGSWFGLGSLGYDFSENLGIDTAFVRFDLVQQQQDANNNGTRPFDNVYSLNGKFENGPLGFWGDISFGAGHPGASDIFGLHLMPFYDLTDKLQLVGSYNYLNGTDNNSVRLDRYESRLQRGRVDEVHEFYAGLNYYLCGHKLKWQNGVEYTTANDRANDGGDYDGWGVTSGFRIGW